MFHDNGLRDFSGSLRKMHAKETTCIDPTDVSAEMVCDSAALASEQSNRERLSDPNEG